MCMGMRIPWEWDSHGILIGMGNIFEWAWEWEWEWEPTGWEWERLIFIGSQIIPVHLINHSGPIPLPYRLTVFTARKLWLTENIVSSHSIRCDTISCSTLPALLMHGDFFSKTAMDGNGNGNGGNGNNGNGNKVLSWERIRMGMTMTWWAWDRLGAAKVISAHPHYVVGLDQVSGSEVRLSGPALSRFHNCIAQLSQYT